MKKSTPATVSLPYVMLSCLADPRTAMVRLLSKETHLPFTFTSAALFFAICIAPALTAASDQKEIFDINLFFSVTLTGALTVALTSILLWVILKTVGRGPISLRKSFACLAYSSAPMTTIMLVILIMNIVLQGDITVATFVATGQVNAGDFIIQIFPYITIISLLLSYITLSYGLSAAAQASLGAGLMTASITIFLMLGSFVLSLHFHEFMLPLSSSQIIGFFSGFLAFPAR